MAGRSSVDGETVTISRSLFDLLASVAIDRAYDFGSVSSAEEAVSICCRPEFRRLMTSKHVRECPAWLRKYFKRNPLSSGLFTALLSRAVEPPRAS